MKASRLLVFGFSLLLLVVASRATSWAQNVTYDETLHSASRPENWITYGGNYASQRFSELKQINTENVSNLKMQWVYQLRNQGMFESSPLVVDGIMYVTEPPTTVTALDVRTGRPLWRWTAKLPQHLLTIGLFPTNRGVAILGDTIYVATIDAHLVALDAKTGAEKWSVEIGNNADAVAITQAMRLIRSQDYPTCMKGEETAQQELAQIWAQNTNNTWSPKAEANPARLLLYRPSGVFSYD